MDLSSLESRRSSSLHPIMDRHSSSDAESSPPPSSSPKGLPRTRLLDEITAAANTYLASNPFGGTQFRSEWDLSRTPSRRLLRSSPPLSETPSAVSAAMHYAESDIPLPPPPPLARAIRRPRSRPPEQPTVEPPILHYERSFKENNFSSLSRHNPQYFSNVDLFQQNDENFNYLKYSRAAEIRPSRSLSPHVRIMDFCFDLDSRSAVDRLMLRAPDYRRILHHITLELFAGDVLCLLYTSESEVQTLLRVLANSENPEGKVCGVLEINGHKLKHRQFGERIGHISVSKLPSGLTLFEHLDIYSSLIQPATNSFKRQETIEQLIQGLALSPFRGQLVECLGQSEIQRLKLASKMLMDTDILISENILGEMDLYDMAFVIDFVRDWAQRLKRIVVIALNPPTIEILNMFGKAAILASGRLVFANESSEMIDYFRTVGYNCPPFKNPLDLVTHDVLTTESARESMTRIRTLAEIWTHKSPPLHPPRPNIVSPKVQYPSAFSRIFILYKMFWFRSLNRPVGLCSEVGLAILISLFVGWIFFQLPVDRRSGINDRQGFVGSLLLFAQFPLSLYGSRTVINDWPMIEHDFAFHSYSKVVYLFAKLIFDLPLSTIAAISYAIPSFIMANQNPIVDSEIGPLISFSVLIAVNYLICRYVVWCCTFVTPAALNGSFIGSLIFGFILIFSGFMVHPDEQLFSQIQLYNPAKLLGAQILNVSFTGHSPTLDAVSWLFDLRQIPNRTEIIVDCQKKKILATKLKQIPIYTVSQCLKTTGSEAYRYSGFRVFTNLYQYHFTLGIIILMILCSLIAFVHQRHSQQRSLHIRTLS